MKYEIDYKDTKLPDEPILRESFALLVESEQDNLATGNVDNIVFGVQLAQTAINLGLANPSEVAAAGLIFYPICLHRGDSIRASMPNVASISRSAMSETVSTHSGKKLALAVAYNYLREWVSYWEKNPNEPRTSEEVRNYGFTPWDHFEIAHQQMKSRLSGAADIIPGVAHEKIRALLERAEEVSSTQSPDAPQLVTLER